MLTANEIQKAKQEQRKAPTDAEVAFRSRLDDADIAYKFQIILGFYIADFVLMDKALVVEIDGGYHSTAKQQWYDVRRDAFIKKSGLKVLRIQNEDVADFDLASFDEHDDVPQRYTRGCFAALTCYKGVEIARGRKYGKGWQSSPMFRLGADKFQCSDGEPLPPVRQPDGMNIGDFDAVAFCKTGEVRQITGNEMVSKKDVDDARKAEAKKRFEAKGGYLREPVGTKW